MSQKCDYQPLLCSSHVSQEGVKALFVNYHGLQNKSPKVLLFTSKDLNRPKVNMVNNYLVFMMVCFSALEVLLKEVKLRKSAITGVVLYIFKYLHN